jgi:hypothetical protein
MARRRREESSEPTHELSKKARTPEQRLLQLQALAVDTVERRLREGTASGAEILYFLKTTSPKEIRELEQLELQNELLRAKIGAIQTEQESNRIYADALKAFAGYRPALSKDDVIDGEFY